MNDMSKVIVAKSDQVNADDLIAGPRTIRITKVVIGSGEQPVNVYFEGDDNKPWRPCKSMCRLLVAAWGPDASTYAGRSVTLYRDPTVKWGGLETGGIRISHMSHLEHDMLVALTVTRGKRAPYTVKMLREQKRESQPPKGKSEGLESLLAAYEMAATLADVEALVAPTRALFPELTSEEKATVRAAAKAAKERATVNDDFVPDEREPGDD